MKNLREELGEMTLGDKMEPILADIADVFLAHDTEMPNDIPRFSKRSLICASIIFSKVVLDRMWAMQEEEDMPFNQRVQMALHFGETLHDLIEQMTAIDLHKTFKDD